MNDDRRILKHRSWIQRYPRVFSLTGGVFFTLIVFSTPLYHAYGAMSFSDPPIEKNEK